MNLRSRAKERLLGKDCEGLILALLGDCFGLWLAGHELSLVYQDCRSGPYGSDSRNRSAFFSRGKEPSSKL